LKKKQKSGAAEAITARQQPSRTDPQGSWTGLPADETEQPVQDADDL